MAICDVIIIGGGYSGLISAIECAKKLGGDKVTVIERLNRVGKKILSTGNGRGNITNVSISKDNYHGENNAFCEYAIKTYDNKSVIKFFEELGLIAVIENGKYYPSGFQAQAVLDVLRLKLASLGVSVITDEQVKDVKKKDNFTVSTAKNTYICKKLIIATGGKSQKQFGTDGNFIGVIKSLGHSVTELYPSLVQLKTEKEKIKGLKGIKQNAKVSLLSSEKVLAESTGDLLFTDYGVSGDAVFKVSSSLEGNFNAEISVDFLPEISVLEIKRILTEKSKIPYLTCEDFMTGILHKTLGKLMLKLTGINDLTTSAKEINIEKLSNLIKNYKIKVVGTLGFDYSQVTHGGVRTNELDDKTMQSKIVDGLYFVGEVIDIDGDCGGYNLQWAYSSAMLASKDVAK